MSIFSNLYSFRMARLESWFRFDILFDKLWHESWWLELCCLPSCLHDLQYDSCSSWNAVCVRTRVEDLGEREKNSMTHLIVKKNEKVLSTWFVQYMYMNIYLKEYICYMCTQAWWWCSFDGKVPRVDEEKKKKNMCVDVFF